jgi:hypothetical protein
MNERVKRRTGQRGPPAASSAIGNGRCATSRPVASRAPSASTACSTSAPATSTNPRRTLAGARGSERPTARSCTPTTRTSPSASHDCSAIACGSRTAPAGTRTQASTATRFRRRPGIRHEAGVDAGDDARPLPVDERDVPRDRARPRTRQRIGRPSAPAAGRHRPDRQAALPHEHLHRQPNARGRFVEDDWTSGTVRVGRDVVFADVKPTVWCVTSTLAQEELPRDLSILRTIAQHHRGCLGVYASVPSAGTIRVGDPVTLLR